MRIAFLMAHEGVEQIEFTRPWEALSQTGETPQVISTRPGSVQGFNHLDKAGTFPVDQTAAEASPDDFDALVLPGGVANPDALRMDADAVAFAAKTGAAALARRGAHGAGAIRSLAAS